MAKKKRRKKGKFKLFVLGCICALVIYQEAKPLPTPSDVLSSTKFQVSGNPSVSMGTNVESAFATNEGSFIASTSNETPLPIASLTKMMTAYLVLKHMPLHVGEAGPTYTFSPQAAQLYQQDLRANDSVLPVFTGEKLSEYQMLEGLLLPSGDNIAENLAVWVDGSVSKFVQEMNQTAKALGMTQTHYSDTSGVNPNTQSTAMDQIRMVSAVMKNPVFREIVAEPQVTLPYAGLTYNVNDALGKNGIVGVKTGSTNQAGGCYVSAKQITVNGHSELLYGAWLGQVGTPMLQIAINHSVRALNQIAPQIHLTQVVQTNQIVGYVRANWTRELPITANRSLSLLTFPGFSANEKLIGNQLQIQTSFSTYTIPVTIPKLPQATFFWRLFH